MKHVSVSLGSRHVCGGAQKWDTKQTEHENNPIKLFSVRFPNDRLPLSPLFGSQSCTFTHKPSSRPVQSDPRPDWGRVIIESFPFGSHSICNRFRRGTIACLEIISAFQVRGAAIDSRYSSLRSRLLNFGSSR